MEYYMYYTAREVFYVYNAIYSYIILIIFMYNTRVLYLPIANEMEIIPVANTNTQISDNIQIC